MPARQNSCGTATSGAQHRQIASTRVWQDIARRGAQIAVASEAGKRQLPSGST